MATTILIVDDEANLRKTLAEILHARGYGIPEADDGSTAIELLKTAVPDLIISDWKMHRLHTCPVTSVPFVQSIQSS